MDRSTRHRQSEAPRIPLRPELVEFMDVRSLCQYQCCSKACGKDVREANAWSLLAGVQAPRSVKEALESDALSRVRSQTRRRILADALNLPDKPFRPSQFRDFTFFVRITDRGDRGRVIWEGDLQTASNDCIDLSLTNVTADIKRSGVCPKLIDYLAQTATDGDADMDVLGWFEITLIAIRDVDQAMVSIGHFEYNCHHDGEGDPDQRFYFSCHGMEALFGVPGFNFRSELYLKTWHDNDGGVLDQLALGVLVWEGEMETGNLLGNLDNSQIQYLLSYLAGVPRQSVRDEALRTIESWVADSDIDSE